MLLLIAASSRCTWFPVFGLVPLLPGPILTCHAVAVRYQAQVQEQDLDNRPIGSHEYHTTYVSHGLAYASSSNKKKLFTFHSKWGIPFTASITGSLYAKSDR